MAGTPMELQNEAELEHVHESQRELDRLAQQYREAHQAYVRKAPAGNPLSLHHRYAEPNPAGDQATMAMRES